MYMCMQQCICIVIAKNAIVIAQILLLLMVILWTVLLSYTVTDPLGSSHTHHHRGFDMAVD